MGIRKAEAKQKLRRGKDWCEKQKSDKWPVSLPANGDKRGTTRKGKKIFFMIITSNSLPLLPPRTAFPGSPSYRPQTTSSTPPHRLQPASGRPPSPCPSTTPVIAHIKRWRCIRWRCWRCSQIISAHVSRFHSRISGWFVQFWLSLGLHSFKFWCVLTAAWQKWTPDSDSELDFDGFWPWSLVKTDILRQIWAPRTMWNEPDWDVRCEQLFEWRWQRFCCDVPDSNDSLTSRRRLIYVNLCFHLYLPYH